MLESRGNLVMRQRIFGLFLLFGVIMVFLSGRLIWIQVFQTDYLRSMALDQRLRLLQIEPKRGVIFDREGRELAVSASAETVVALPPEIINPEDTARVLQGVLNFSYDEILRRLQQPRAAIYLERKLDDERAQTVRELDLPGITFIEESQRFYPQKELAAHVLGFVGIDSQGLEGIEVAMEEYLAGIPGRIASEKDAIGLNIPQGFQLYIPPKDGMDIYLTIDLIIQHIVERELERALAENETKGGTIIALDPRSGEVLALANRPAFDPNEFNKYAPKLWRNVAISDSYEPGSAFKIVTMTAALDEGVVSLSDHFFDPGSIKVAGEEISCWRAGGHGSQSFRELVINSCNPGFVQVGMRLGKDNFHRYIQAFNFGQRLGINLPGEARGMVYTYAELGPVELATMTFGHGIAVTPLQMVMAASVLANDGFLMEPRIVREVRDKEGNLVEQFDPQVIRQVISRETAELALDLLGDAVASGTGSQAGISGFLVGGKTGTAKHYGREAYDSSFVGIFPLNEPQVVIIVVFYEVTSGPYYGSQLAAPVFREVAIDIIRYLGIKPSATPDEIKLEQDPENVVVPNVVNNSTAGAIEILRSHGLNVRLEGAGRMIVEQLPQAGAEVPWGTTVILFYADTISEKSRYYLTVPDLKGRTLREAADILASLGFMMQFEGSGKVTGQTPQAGERAPVGSKVEIILR